MRILLWLSLAVLAAFVLPVLALRWLPVPTTAFMLQSEKKPVRYQWLDAAQIPDVARRAVVASEDQKFFEHDGFDIEAMQKAHAQNQKSKRKRGASTISQQTAKNLFLWSGGGYFRKGLEAVYTVLIEALWPKQRILTVYLNIAEFGAGIYGVEAASQAFFNKPAARLSVAEAARLAAVLPSPRKWSAARPGPYVQKRSAWISRQMGYGPRAAPAEEPEAPSEMEVDQDPAENGNPTLTTEPTPAAEPAASPESEPATLPLEPPPTEPVPVPVPEPEPVPLPPNE